MSEVRISEGDVVTELFILGPRLVRVVSVNHSMNMAVIQFRDLDGSPSAQNCYSVTLEKLVKAVKEV